MGVAVAALHSPGAGQGRQGFEIESHPKFLVLSFSLDNKRLGFVLGVEVDDLGKV